MMIVAVVNDWVVTSIEQIDESEYQALANQCQLAIDVTNISPQPQVGWIFNGSNLISNGNVNWQITRLAFRERFTVPELLGIIAASQQSNSMGLTLQMMMQNQMISTFIDLSRSDTIAGVEALVSFNLITSDRANQILTTQPTAQELYKG